jgi:hypothetical protein
MLSKYTHPAPENQGSPERTIFSIQQKQIIGTFSARDMRENQNEETQSLCGDEQCFIYCRKAVKKET